jgi:hypothetical protein
MASFSKELTCWWCLKFLGGGYLFLYHLPMGDITRPAHYCFLSATAVAIRQCGSISTKLRFTNLRRLGL